MKKLIISLLNIGLVGLNAAPSFASQDYTPNLQIEREAKYLKAFNYLASTSEYNLETLSDYDKLKSGYNVCNYLISRGTSEREIMFYMLKENKSQLFIELTIISYKAASISLCP